MQSQIKKHNLWSKSLVIQLPENFSQRKIGKTELKHLRKWKNKLCKNQTEIFPKSYMPLQLDFKIKLLELLQKHNKYSKIYSINVQESMLII